jgi:hypothetical protein
MRRPMRGAALTLALLFSACSSVAGLDGYCVLEDSAPPGAACRLVPESCGCGDGMTCRPDPAGAGRSCSATGSLAPGDRCTTSLECPRNTTCLGPIGLDYGHCRAFCQGDDDCRAVMGEGSLCIPDAAMEGVCTEPCVPGADDEDCGPGLACDVLLGVPYCRSEGPAGAGDPCGGGGDRCTRGRSCTFDTGSMRDECFLICGPGLDTCAGDNVCVVPTSRTEARRAEPPEWGVCATLG